MVSEAQPVTPRDPPPLWSHESTVKEIAVQVAFWAVYLLLDRASMVFRLWAGTPAWYLPAGIGVAVLLCGGLRYAPVFLAGCATAAFVDCHRPLLSWAGVPGAVGSALWYVVGAVWLRRIWRLELGLRSLRDVGGLVVFLCVFALPSAVTGALAIRGDGLVSQSEYFKAAFNWWVGDSISVTSFTPFLLLYIAPRVANFLAGTAGVKATRGSVLRRLKPADVFRVAAELTLIMTVLWLALVFKPTAAYMPLSLLILPIIYVAVRYGFARTTLAVLVVNVGVIAAAHLTHPDPEGLGRRQLVMLALALTGLCVGTVVSERRQAEEALRLSEEKFARAFQVSPAALSISTLEEGRLLEVNDTFLRVFECDREAVIGKTSLELNLWADPEDRPRMVEALRRQPRIVNQERVHRSASGKTFTVLSSIETFELHGVPCLLATFVDITQAKQAQQALRASEQRYRDFISHSHEGLWRIELERPLPADLLEPEMTAWLLKYAYCAECNLAHARNLGFSTPEEVVGKRLGDLIPAWDAGRQASLRIPTGDGFRSRTFESEGLDKDGNRLALLRTEVPIVEDGKLVRIWGITRDLTDLKRAEEAWRESDARLRLVVSQIPAIVWSTDLEMRLTSHLGAGLQALGLEANQVLGLPVDQCVSRLGIQPEPPDPRRALRGESLKYEAVIGGRTYDVQLGPLRNVAGEITGILGIALDISERKRAEMALRESEDRFRAIFENAGIGMALGDLEGHAIKSNAALQEMLGYTGEELRRLAFTEYTHPDDRELDWNLFRELGEGRRDRYDIEKRDIRKDGQVRWIHLTVSVVKDREGAPKYAIGMVEDISERKRAEDRLCQLNAELEHRVAERTHQLRVTNRELEIRNRELTASNQDLEAFSYSVAHDLRAPLRQIQGFSRLLLEDHRAKLAPEAQEFLRDIAAGTRHMGRLIDDLLELSRIGRRELNLEVTGLASVVEGVRQDLAHETGRRDVRWQISELPFVECDAALVKLVFSNLLSNALKYTKHRKPAVIEIGQTPSGGPPVVFVKDNGVGFNMRHAGKLFGVFQRLHRREDFDGTGVGLATVKRIVQKHGGRIWVEAELDKGATFYFTLADRPSNEPGARGRGDDTVAVERQPGSPGS